MCLSLTGDVFISRASNKNYALVREADMPTWLGPEAIGFMGSDTYGELNADDDSGLVFEPLTPNGAKIVLANFISSEEELDEPYQIATSYPRLATKLLLEKDITDFSIAAELGGSVEIAPCFIPGVNAVVDVVKSGETMRAAGLSVYPKSLMEVTLGMIWRDE